MPYCDSLVCCYIMKCCVCNKSSLLLCMCTGGNVTQFGAGLEVLVCWSLQLACFIRLLFHFYLYILSYSCCFFVMFVYLRLIWMDRARAHLALPHQTSHHTFTLNLLDGFCFVFSVWMRGRMVPLFVWIKKCLPLSSYMCLYFKIGYFIYLSKRNSVCCMLCVYQKDKKKKCIFPTQSFIGMFQFIGIKRTSLNLEVPI